jgi:L-fuconolactonase
MQHIIDTHVHTWNFRKAEYQWLKNNTTILNRDYDLQELEPERVKAGITAGVLVQAANTLQEHDYMLHLAANTPWIAGVVGWLPLEQPRQAERLLVEKYLSNPYFKGVRHLIHDEPDARWLLQDKVIASLSVLARYHIPYDVVGILPQHIETALEVAEKVPNLIMIFDHLNQPPIATRERFGRWGSLMKQAAAHKKMHVKISGLGTTCQNNGQWTSRDIQPYIEFVLEYFGDDRCCCGGDWPVSLLAGSYTKTWQAYKDVLQTLPAASQNKVFSENARRIYKLP